MPSPLISPAPTRLAPTSVSSSPAGALIAELVCIVVSTWRGSLAAPWLRSALTVTASELTIEPPFKSNDPTSTITPSVSLSSVWTTYSNTRVFVPLPEANATAISSPPTSSKTKGVPVTSTAWSYVTVTVIVSPSLKMLASASIKPIGSESPPIAIPVISAGVPTTVPVPGPLSLPAASVAVADTGSPSS